MAGLKRGQTKLSPEELRQRMNERARLYRLNNPEKVKERNRYYRELNKSGKRAYDQAYRVANADRILDTKYRRFYGVSLAEYRQLEQSQKGLCAICLQPETAVYRGTPRKLAVDHCHETGRIRGLLCSNCNTALGKFDDDPKRIEAAIRYLCIRQPAP